MITIYIYNNRYYNLQSFRMDLFLFRYVSSFLPVAIVTHSTILRLFLPSLLRKERSFIQQSPRLY